MMFKKNKQTKPTKGIAAGFLFSSCSVAVSSGGFSSDAVFVFKCKIILIIREPSQIHQRFLQFGFCTGEMFWTEVFTGI